MVMGHSSLAAQAVESAMKHQLKDRVVLVTGGSRGIGKAIVETAAGAGALVAFTYLKANEEAESLEKQLTAQGTSVCPLQADVRNFEAMQSVISKTVERFGRLDALVNNAGVVRDKALMMMSVDDWREVIDTNLTGVFNVCRAAIVTLMKQRFGRIVNITSVAGLAGMAGQVNYSASKAGIIGLTKSLAKEVAAYNITVNAVAPGFIESDMTKDTAAKKKDDLLKQIPLGRFGQANEVAHLVTYLLSEQAAYITGQVMVLDGGLTL